MQAYASFHQVQRGTDVKAWLYHILSRSLTTVGGRPQPRHQPTAVDHSKHGQPAEARCQNDSGMTLAESQTLSRVSDSEIKRALQELPADARLAGYLASVENYTYAEIGDIIGAPIPTVASLLRRGRRRLRELLLGYATTAAPVPQ